MVTTKRVWLATAGSLVIAAGIVLAQGRGAPQNAPPPDIRRPVDRHVERLQSRARRNAAEGTVRKAGCRRGGAERDLAGHVRGRLRTPYKVTRSRWRADRPGGRSSSRARPILAPRTEASTTGSAAPPRPSSSASTPTRSPPACSVCPGRNEAGPSIPVVATAYHDDVSFVSS